MSLLKIKPFIIDDTTASDAFVQANAAFLQANSSGSFANSAFDRANAAYDAANTGSPDSWARTQANNAYDTANSSGNFANGSFVVANSASIFANSAFDRANAAYTQANNSTDTWVRTQANNAYDTANSAGSFANGAFITANTSYSWGNHASAGYATTIYVGDAIANLVNSAPVTLDTLNELAAALGNDANFSTTIATSLGVTNSFANGAFLRANASYIAQNTTADFANGAFLVANSASSNTITIQGVDLTQNTNITSAQAFANGAFDRANAAYAQANTGGGSSSDSWARAQANAAYEQANTASNTANSFTGNIAVNIDNFTGDGSTTNFTMSTAPTDANNVIINVNGVIQLKSAYTVTANSTTLTLSSAPADGAKVDAIIFKSGAVSSTSGGGSGTTRAQSMTMSILFGA